ncbi:adenylosuccinate lyase [Helicobacter muridarum]|uniref:Adenylosuccinate lyase n=1 Tax=Helicobacter muridarum TaxID=216 RepID=A0A099TX65_9HELI|nr:adenylosuccinate lyase [Helicobacter muridarum]
MNVRFYKSPLRYMGGKSIKGAESIYLQYLLVDNELVGLIGEENIKECFDFSYYTKNVDSIFKRVFGEGR